MNRNRKTPWVAGNALSWIVGATLGLILGLALLIGLWSVVASSTGQVPRPKASISRALLTALPWLEAHSRVL